MRFDFGLDGFSFPCGFCSECHLAIAPRLHQLCSFTLSFLGILQCPVYGGLSLSCVCQIIPPLAFWILHCILLSWTCTTLASGLLYPSEPFKTRSGLCVRGRRPRVSWILFVCLGLRGVDAMEPRLRKVEPHLCPPGLRDRRHWRVEMFGWMISELGSTPNMA